MTLSFQKIKKLLNIKTLSKKILYETNFAWCYLIYHHKMVFLPLGKSHELTFQININELRLHKHQANNPKKKKEINRNYSQWWMVKIWLGSDEKPEQKCMYWNHQDNCSGHQLMIPTTWFAIFSRSSYFQFQKLYFQFYCHFSF